MRGWEVPLVDPKTIVLRACLLRLVLACVRQMITSLVRFCRAALLAVQIGTQAERYGYCPRSGRCRQLPTSLAWRARFVVIRLTRAVSCAAMTGFARLLASVS
jgi:hypothetical protein